MSRGHYFIQTYGCQMNEHDTETIAGLLTANDYEAVATPVEADVILINTCCIREKAENKVLSLLGEMKTLMDDRPDRIIGVCGCMVQQKDIVPKILRAAPFVRLLTGTNQIHEIPNFIHQIQLTGQPVYDIGDDPAPMDQHLPTKRRYPFKAFVNIIYGCNNFCTYCVVPYVRGRERSRKMDDIVDEVKALVQDGVKEVTLLGQNVNSYGNDFGGADLFPRLLQALDDIDGLERIRFMTSHPKDLSDALIETIRDSKHICPSIHLPVQSGSDRILKKMNRKYTRAHYLERLARIRQEIPRAAITTDIIVGFPGETEADFADTLDLVEQAQFDNAFSFVYSKREGTVAATMAVEAILLETKKERLRRLNERLGYWSRQQNQKYANQVVKVLVDGVSKNNSVVLNGRTDTGKTVLFEGSEDWIGEMIFVKIDEVQTWVIKGHRIEMEDEK